MQCTLSGTLYIYQGEEIGMANLPSSWSIEDYKDIASQDMYNDTLRARQQKEGMSEPDMSDVLDIIYRKARDHARSPMQWSAEKQADFSDADTTWMRVNEDYREWNVASQRGVQGTVLESWRSMLAFRKKHLACVRSHHTLHTTMATLTTELQTYGVFFEIPSEDERVFAYTKAYRAETVFVALNFSDETVSCKQIPQLGSARDRIGNYTSSGLFSNIENGRLELRPWEAIVLATA